MKKVLLVANGALNKTGVPSLMLELSKILINQNYEVDLIYFYNEGNDLINEFIKEGINVFLLTNTSYKDIFSFIKEHGEYYVIHCFNEYSSVPFLIAAKKLKIHKRIIHTNGMVHTSKSILKRLYLFFLRYVIKRNANIFLGCSIMACKSAYTKATDFIVFPNLYNENQFFFSKIKENTPISLIQVGSIQPNKNQFFSILVLENIIKFFPDSKLFLIGNQFYKNYVNELKTYCASHNLVNNVIFLNFDIDQQTIYEKSHFCIFPSLVEAFGTVLIEAQAIGVSCFASDTVTKETNLGGVEYLPLSEGPQYWANSIIAKYNTSKNFREKYDTSKHTKKHMEQVVSKIYE